MNDQLDNVLPVIVRNDSGEAIPSFGVMQVSGAEAENGTSVVTVVKPTGASGQYLLNGPHAIPASAPNNYGKGWRAFGLRAQYDSADGTPALGESWGPESGSWKLHKDVEKFVVVGHPINSKTVRVNVESEPSGSSGSDLLRVVYVPATDADQDDWFTNLSIDQRDHSGLGAPAATWTYPGDTTYPQGRRLKPSLAKAILLTDLLGRTGAEQFTETADQVVSQATIDVIAGVSSSTTDPIPMSDLTNFEAIVPEGQGQPPPPTEVQNDSAETYEGGDQLLLDYDSDTQVWSLNEVNPMSVPTATDNRIDVLWWSVKPLVLSTSYYRYGLVQLEGSTYHDIGVDCGTLPRA